VHLSLYRLVHLRAAAQQHNTAHSRAQRGFGEEGRRAWVSTATLWHLMRVCNRDRMPRMFCCQAAVTLYGAGRSYAVTAGHLCYNGDNCPRPCLPLRLLASAAAAL
jgi:hypothetical protein